MRDSRLPSHTPIHNKYNNLGYLRPTTTKRERERRKGGRKRKKERQKEREKGRKEGRKEGKNTLVIESK